MLGDPLSAHAVHLALALFELDLLHVPDNIQSPLLSRDPGERGPARLVSIIYERNKYSVFSTCDLIVMSFGFLSFSFLP